MFSCDLRLLKTFLFSPAWIGLLLIPAMGHANRSVAEYNGMLRRLPNSHLLLTPLRLQEAVLSSRIEGTLATMSEVLQFEAGAPPERESRRQDIEEILNYRSALNTAMQELATRPFSLNLLLKLHKQLMSSVRGHNKAPGEFRRQQNYIGSRISGVERVRFIPPDWMKLEHSLSNWEKYYHSDDDPLGYALPSSMHNLNFSIPSWTGMGASAEF